MKLDYRQLIESKMYPGSAPDDYSIEDFTKFIMVNMDINMKHLRFMYESNTPISISIDDKIDSKKWEYRLWINPETNCFDVEVYDGETYDSYVPKHILNHIVYLIEKKGLKLKCKTIKELYNYLNSQINQFFAGANYEQENE